MEIPGSALTHWHPHSVAQHLHGQAGRACDRNRRNCPLRAEAAVEARAALHALHATMDQVGSASRQAEEPARAVKHS